MTGADGATASKDRTGTAAAVPPALTGGHGRALRHWPVLETPMPDPRHSTHVRPLDVSGFKPVTVLGASP